TLFRSAGRDVSACPATADGPCTNFDNHAVRRTRPAGCLARIRPCHGEAQGVGLLPPLMTPHRPSLEQIFETQIQKLALTLRPDTVDLYRTVVRRFVAYLRASFPELRRLSELRRDPHLLGWFRSLSEQQQPLSNPSRIDYLVRLRRLLDDLNASGHAVRPDLIRGEDFPPQPRYLPRPLSPQEDQLLGQELRRTDDLYANTLLLLRATGIRLGECIH